MPSLMATLLLWRTHPDRTKINLNSIPTGDDHSYFLDQLPKILVCAEVNRTIFPTKTKIQFDAYSIF